MGIACAQRVRLLCRDPGRGRGEPRPAAAGGARGLRGRLRAGRQSRDRQAADRGRADPRHFGGDRRGRSRSSAASPTARTIGAYGLPILRDAPEVTVELLESDEEPGGVTELAVPVAAPAIANAYFSLTGQRVRTACRSCRSAAPPMSAKIGVLLINLGTPDAPEPAAVRRYLKRIPVRSARGRDSAAGLAADPARHHPQHPAEEVRPRLSPGLDRGRLAARRDHRAPGRGRWRGAFGAERDRRSCDALRQAGDRRADRRAAGGGLRPDPDRAALSAILRGDDRDRQRRGVRASAPPALAAGGAHAAALS